MIGLLSPILTTGGTPPPDVTSQQTTQDIQNTVEEEQEEISEIKKNLSDRVKGGFNTAKFILKTPSLLLKPFASLGSIPVKTNIAFLLLFLIGFLAFLFTYQFVFWFIGVNFFTGLLFGILTPGIRNRVQALLHFIMVGFAISLLQYVVDFFIVPLLESSGWFRLLILFILYLLYYMPWITYLVFIQNFIIAPLRSFSAALLVIALILILFGAMVHNGYIQRQQLQGAAVALKGEFFPLFEENWNNIVNATVRGVERAQNRSDDVFRYATGSYEENIDKNAQVQTLGIRFKEIQLSNIDGVYFQGDPISAWAVLESKSLDREIPVNASCLIDKKLGPNLWKEGIVNNPQFSIFDLDYRDITCSFPRHTFPDIKSHTLEIIADFDFTTNSYLRRYFIRQQDSNNFRMNDVDPLVFYEIPREDEIGKFTNGPLEVSIIKNNLLQTIERDTEFVVGIRLDVNRRMGWTNGRLLDIQNLVLSVPDGFKVAQDSEGLFCSHPFVEYSSGECYSDCLSRHSQDRCDSQCGEHLMYKLVATEFDKAKEFGIEYVKTPLIFTCQVVVTSAAEAIGGQNPIGIGNFRASADYRFRTSIEKPFRITEKSGYVNPMLVKDFCGFKTTYLDTDVQINAAGVATLSKDLVRNPKQPVENVTISDDIIQSMTGGVICPQIIKGIIAYRKANPGSSNLLGYTGITSQQLVEISASSDADFKETLEDIVYTTEYLIKKLNSEECQYQDGKLLDCALGYFFCDNPSGPCATTHVPRIVQVAKYYGES